MIDNKAHIGNLKVTAKQDNTFVLLFSLKNSLSSMNFHPSGLPPSAILIVHHLVDPLPKHLRPYRYAVHINTNWEKAVQNTLANSYQNAARPVNGYIPSNTNSVIFTDESEMLACLTFDITQGQAWQQWRWKVILRNIGNSQGNSIKRILCERALFVPAALHYLSNWGKVMPVLNALYPQDAMTVLSAVQRAYEIADFISDSFYHTTPQSHDFQSTVFTQSESHKGKKVKSLDENVDLESHLTLPEQSVKPPWQRYIPQLSVPKALEREKACLLGLGLVLFNKPSLAQSTIFLKELNNWWKAQEKVSLSKTNSIDHPLLHYGTNQSQIKIKIKESELNKEELRKNESVENRRKTQTEALTKAEKKNIIIFEQEYAIEKKDINTDIRTKLDSKISTNQEILSFLKSSSSDEKKRADAELVHDEQPLVKSHDYKGKKDKNKDKDELLTEQTLTEKPKGELSKDKTDVITHKSKAVSSKKYQEEAKHTEHTLYPFGEEYFETHLSGVLYLINMMMFLNIPDCYEKKWRIASQVGAWGVLELLGRALVAIENHYGDNEPLWFALAQLDGREPGTLPGSSYCLPDSQKHSAHTDSSEIITCPLLKGLNPDLAQWLVHILPSIRLYLHKALNPKNDKQWKLDEALFHYSGRPYVTKTHVDLIMSLDDISIPICIAGLDRNPGWVPEFGRVIYFHYE